jgi:nicotinate-nucleotide adenylyltransferase
MFHADGLIEGLGWSIPLQLDIQGDIQVDVQGAVCHCLTHNRNMIHTALFGTSADPPTLGHQAILEWLATQFNEVAVWAADNPFKVQQTPLHHRQAMLARLVEAINIKASNVTLYPKLAHSRTLHSVQQAQADFPNTRLTLVVGSDLVNTLPTWFHAGELLQLVELLIVPRPGTPIASTNLNAIKDLGGRFTLAQFEGPDVSSTNYRQQGERYPMIPAIAAYIQQHGLYNHKSP